MSHDPALTKPKSWVQNTHCTDEETEIQRFRILTQVAEMGSELHDSRSCHWPHGLVGVLLIKRMNGRSMI